MLRSTFSVGILAWIFGVPFISRAQPTLLVFEVASIKPNPGPWHVLFGYSSSGNRLTLEAYDVAGLIMEAYNLKPHEIVWPSAVEHYDIVAKAAGDGTPTRDQFRQMLQTLLTDRFGLKFHRESR